MERHTCSQIERFTIVMMAVLHKSIYRLNAILVKIPGVFFIDMSDKLILKFIWKSKGTRITKMILKKEKKVEKITLSYFKMVIKTL